MVRSRIVSSAVWFPCGSVVRLFVSAFSTVLVYKHQEFQFPLLDAAHCVTESEHQVSNGSLIGLFSLFLLSSFTRILELRTK